jgi:YNFM family putative membrane transporter
MLANFPPFMALFGGEGGGEGDIVVTESDSVKPPSTNEANFFRLQALVFTLVAAAITNMYITQPVLPIIEQEFTVGAATASLTVSMVILGIAISNLPFGWLADRYPVHRLIGLGAAIVAVAGFVCAVTPNFSVLVGFRFLQGLFIPALTTCVAAYLSRNLPVERLNVAMGSYVSATVAGGLGGRLLGGWIHPPLHWRWAFVTAGVFVFVSAVAAVRWLPPGEPPTQTAEDNIGFLAILKRRELRRTFLVAFTAFFVFSSSFNYLPFYLSGPPFHLPVQMITFLYLAYIVGIVIGPIAGSISNRLGNGATMIGGSLLFALALLITLIESVAVVAFALLLVCGGFFAIHASAAGSLNRRLTGGRGRANSLYVLFYYLGGAFGITASGWAYGLARWHGVITLGLLVLIVPLAFGFQDLREERWQPAVKDLRQNFPSGDQENKI